MIGTVYWEDDPTRTRDVDRFCDPCGRYEIARGRRLWTLGDVWIVSPSGIGHVQSEEDHERTGCGKVATGDDWWWRL